MLKAIKNKEIIKIINEEISTFDFLGNDENLKEQEYVNLLKNEELQKQFICDSLLNKKDKIKIIDIIDSQIGGNWNENNLDDISKLTIDYYLKIQYKYDLNKEPIIFELDFGGDNVSIGAGGQEERSDYLTPPSSQAWFNYFNWNDIDVSIFTLNGDDIEFIAFKRAPQKIQALFIREYTADFIGNETKMDIRTKEMKNNVRNIPYC